jgi:hypothetical protein
MRPKLHARRIVGEDENVAFLNASLAEFRQTGSCQLPAYPTMAIPPGYRQMMKVTAPAIVAAQHGANDPAILLRNETEARVASQKCGNGIARVGFV